MPLVAAEHPQSKIENFLWGLLPDNEAILQRWAQRFQVSAKNVFALIAHVGEDCAGAIQFVTPERYEALGKHSASTVEWLDENGVAQRLAALRVDHAAWRKPQDAGQFSLAGVQPKTALLYQGGRWGVPSGRIPTSHILKPPNGEFDGHAENEYSCLNLARAVGLPAANAEVKWFGNEVAIVVERYDRLTVDGHLHRVHQEDTCQALSIPPWKKYQNEGGPGPKEIVDLLRANSTAREEDIETFIGALAFNWLIAGTDAHAKNYSILLGSAGAVRLAPLYDVASAIPYPALDQGALKLAMKLGGHYELRDISVHDWTKLAVAARIDEERVLTQVQRLAQEICDQVTPLLRSAKADGLGHPILAALSKELVGRAKQCQKIINFRRTS